MALKAFIIDDEAHARTVLKTLLQRNFPEVDICGEAESIPKAMDAIHEHKPDVLFLDIEMPHFSGLQIHEFLKDGRNFEIIFVTAYNQYAINAIKLSAFDYLLKPLQINELRESISRLQHKINKTDKTTSSEKLKILQQNMDHAQPKKLVIHTHQGTRYFELDKITHLEASGMYTIIHMKQEQFVASKPLKDFEEMLTSNFYRVHRSFIVNCSQIDTLSNKDGGYISLRNEKIIPISRSKKEGLLELLNSGIYNL